jgi:hypothetical protein
MVRLTGTDNDDAACVNFLEERTRPGDAHACEDQGAGFDGFYTDMNQSRAGRASVLDRWELEQRKITRGRPNRPVQVVAPVQAVQVVDGSKKRSLPRLRRAR